MMVAESRPPAPSLAWLLHDLDAAPTLPALEVAGLATDSRALQPGDLFLAAQGLQAHGLRYAEQALARGAAAVVWEPVEDAELQRLAASLAVPTVAVPGLGHKLGIIADRFYAHPTDGMRIIGVTGTDGKTSVSHFIAQARSAADCWARWVTASTVRCARPPTPRRTRCVCRPSSRRCVTRVCARR